LYFHLITPNWVRPSSRRICFQFHNYLGHESSYAITHKHCCAADCIFFFGSHQIYVKQYIKFCMCLRHFHSVQFLGLCYRLKISFCFQLGTVQGTGWSDRKEIRLGGNAGNCMANLRLWRGTGDCMARIRLGHISGKYMTRIRLCRGNGNYIASLWL